MYQPFLPVFLIMTATAGVTLAQIDDFDDGNADGWTISDVLAAVGGEPSEITFPGGNTIRLQSSPSPNPEALGPSRVGFFSSEQSYTDVTVIMDMVAWDEALQQDFGILARGNDIGLGTTGGYALTLDVDEQAIYLSRLDAEAAATLTKMELVMEPGKIYRFRLTAIGMKITAGVAEAAVPQDELVLLEAEDDGYASGVNGFFTNAGVADGPTDATFDRFVAFDPSGPVSPPQIISFDRTGGNVAIDFQVPIQGGGGYVLETSPDLQAWTIAAAGDIPLGITDGRFTVTDQTAPAHYYRVNEAPPLFTEDFESGAEGWTTMVVSGDTRWELGTPAAPELDTAHSGSNAYGTLLDQPYTDSAAAWLRSPVIDLTDKRRPVLSFWYHVDVTEGQEGVQLNYLDTEGNALGTYDEIFWTKTDGWTLVEIDLPEEAVGRPIVLEWFFRSDQEPENGPGFFLDDIVVD